MRIEDIVIEKGQIFEFNNKLDGKFHIVILFAIGEWLLIMMDKKIRFASRFSVQSVIDIKQGSLVTAE